MINFSVETFPFSLSFPPCSSQHRYFWATAPHPLLLSAVGQKPPPKSQPVIPCLLGRFSLAGQVRGAKRLLFLQGVLLIVLGVCGSLTLERCPVTLEWPLICHCGTWHLASDSVMLLCVLFEGLKPSVTCPCSSIVRLVTAQAPWCSTCRTRSSAKPPGLGMGYSWAPLCRVGSPLPQRGPLT